jgi:hypothetical protein
MSSKAAVAEGKPESTPESKGDLRSLAMPELQAKLGSSPDCEPSGLSCSSQPVSPPDSTAS